MGLVVVYAKKLPFGLINKPNFNQIIQKLIWTANFLRCLKSMQILGKDLYKVVKEKYGPNLTQLTSEKVTVVNGDICLADLGIQDSLAHEMIHQVDAIINLAATTKFDERYLSNQHELNFIYCWQ